MLNEVYRMLAYAFGEPVSHFDWEYRDDKKQYHIDQNLTPQSFFEKYVGWNLTITFQSSTPQPTTSLITIPTRLKC